jgi:uncharacterized membrane protein YqaE (UPF0057 family)
MHFLYLWQANQKSHNMKIKWVLFIFSGSIILSSCGSFQDITVQKRRYMEGYYIARSGPHKPAVSHSFDNPRHTPIMSGYLQLGSVPGSLDEQNLEMQAMPVLHYGKEEVQATGTHYSSEKEKSSLTIPGRILEKANESRHPCLPIEQIILVIVAIILPPLAVFLYDNGITWKFWVSLLLTLFFWIPGIIFSLLVVLGFFH